MKVINILIAFLMVQFIAGFFASVMKILCKYLSQDTNFTVIIIFSVVYVVQLIVFITLVIINWEKDLI